MGIRIRQRAAGTNGSTFYVSKEQQKCHGLETNASHSFRPKSWAMIPFSFRLSSSRRRRSKSLISFVILVILVLVAGGLVYMYYTLYSSLLDALFAEHDPHHGPGYVTPHNQHYYDPRQQSLIQQWPILLFRNEEESSLKKERNFKYDTHEDEFEVIVHPAHPGNVNMTVPKFYYNHHIRDDGNVMTPKQASSIGFKIPVTVYEGDSSLEVNNERVTMELPTIFVSIASYRDHRCQNTLESMLKRAKYPERLRIGIIDQIKPGIDIPCNTPTEPCSTNPSQVLCKYSGHIDRYELDASLSVGPVFARHLGNRMYRGEYFILQCDAHMSFIKDWDDEIVSQFFSARNEMAVLSAYPSDISNAINETTGLALHKRRCVMCRSEYEKDQAGVHIRHGVQPEVEPMINGSPQLHPFWAAGFSFARGHFVANVPYDPYLPMVFQGEEISMALRAWTFGYDFYALERNVCFHIYVVGVNKEKRERVPLFWENSKTFRKNNTIKNSMLRLSGIINMNSPEIDPSTWNHAEEKKYGMGSIRSSVKFFQLFGIHPENQTMEENLCHFVQPGIMHHAFLRNLRRDGMGIDYDTIDFTFNGTMYAKKKKSKKKIKKERKY